MKEIHYMLEPLHGCKQRVLVQSLIGIRSKVIISYGDVFMFNTLSVPPHYLTQKGENNS